MYLVVIFPDPVVVRVIVLPVERKL